METKTINDPTHVYLVLGRDGDYSSRTEWAVRVFVEESDAEAMKNRLNEWFADRSESFVRRYADPTLECYPAEDTEYAGYSSGEASYCVIKVPFGLVR